MHIIKGGIKMGKGVDPSELIKKMNEAGVKVKLPFEATGFRSTNKVFGVGGGLGDAPAVEKKQPETVAPVKKSKSKYDRKVLASMKMSELRDIGDEYGVKDNIKSELIDKILKAVK